MEDRDRQIGAIVNFVDRHPESLASRVICRRTAAPEQWAPEQGTDILRERLAVLDEETLTGYYYLVK